MKHLKTFEDIKLDNFKVGDIVFCIEPDNFKLLTIGKVYKIVSVNYMKSLTQNDNKTILLDLFDLDSNKNVNGFFGYRFTKDSNHPAVIKYTAKKYNL